MSHAEKKNNVKPNCTAALTRKLSPMRLVKSNGIIEHVAHISHCRGVPLIQGLVEAPG